MKHSLYLLWHNCRANHYWNVMISKQARTGIPHGLLMVRDRGYRLASVRYNASIEALVGAQTYITAQSLIAGKKVGNACISSERY